MELIAYIVAISLFVGTHGYSCDYTNGTMYCATGCCGTYWNRTCCPATSNVPFINTTRSSYTNTSPGIWCYGNTGNIYCSTGCCGTYWNRTCCPPTRYPSINTTIAHGTTRDTWEWCYGYISRYCNTGCCGTYWERYCCPVTRNSTTTTTTPYPTYNGVWCNTIWGRVQCQYGCCGSTNYTHCCSSTDRPSTSSPEQAVSSSRIVIIVVSCVGAICGVVAILIGVYCCLRTNQGARGQILHPSATRATNFQPAPLGTGPPTYMSAPASGQSYPQTAFPNLTYTPQASGIQNQAYIQGQQSQAVMSSQPYSQPYSQGQQSQPVMSSQPYSQGQQFQAPVGSQTYIQGPQTRVPTNEQECTQGQPIQTSEISPAFTKGQ